MSGAAVTLGGWVGDAVERHGDRVAVELPAGQLTYAQLWEQAGYLARRLRERLPGGGAQARVGLLAGSTAAGYAGYLAVLRLGATVVPLNPSHPPHRTAQILRAARVVAVLADPRIDVATAQVLRGVDIPVVDVTADAAPHRGSAPEADARPQDTAYILFTSGSTGRPKGVPIRHSNALSYLRHAVRRYEVGPDSRLSQTFDLTFDPSVFDLFAAWGSGATVVLPRAGHRLLPADYVNERRLTHWFSVPSVVAMALRTRRLLPGSMPHLRWSVFIGEPLTLDHAVAWRRAALASELENVYGPTELTVSCAEFRLPEDPADWPRTRNGTVPIGQVYPHLEHMLLGPEGEQVLDEGELCVRGAQRFPGYLDPEDDAGGFVPDTPGDPGAYYRTGDLVRVEDGRLVHLGRLDQQTKLNGYRVELGEIEAVLRRHAAVVEAVVLVAPRPDGSAGVHAVHTGRVADPAELEALCRAELAPYMIPYRYHHLAELPLNDNGKVDRTALRALVEPAVAR